jgi:hypothetical protein
MSAHGNVNDIKPAADGVHEIVREAEEVLGLGAIEKER